MEEISNASEALAELVDNMQKKVLYCFSIDLLLAKNPITLYKVMGFL